MMRSWMVKNAKSLIVVSATISIVAHTALIAGWVLGTLPAPGVPGSSIANRLYYIPPPDRVPGRAGTREVIHYITLNASGTGTGEGARKMGNDRPTALDETIGGARTIQDTVVAQSMEETALEDSVYTILEVDSAVVRSSNSAAPAYPPKLLEARIQGFVNAQYVVDTTGYADTLTFYVVQSTNPEFTKAVRDVLPLMRFQPAKIGPTKVRQLVQQQFSFKITGIDSLPPVVPKRSGGPNA